MSAVYSASSDRSVAWRASATASSAAMISLGGSSLTRAASSGSSCSAIWWAMSASTRSNLLRCNGLDSSAAARSARPVVLSCLCCRLRSHAAAACWAAALPILSAADSRPVMVTTPSRSRALDRFSRSESPAG